MTKQSKLSHTIESAYNRVLNYGPKLSDMHEPQYCTLDPSGHRRVDQKTWELSKKTAVDDYDVCFFGLTKPVREWASYLDWSWSPRIAREDVLTSDETPVTLYGFLSRFEPWLEIKMYDPPSAPELVPVEGAGDETETKKLAKSLVRDFETTYGFKLKGGDAKGALGEMSRAVQEVHTQVNALHAARDNYAFQTARERYLQLQSIVKAYGKTLDALQGEERTLKERNESVEKENKRRLMEHQRTVQAIADRKRDKDTLVAEIRRVVHSHMRSGKLVSEVAPVQTRLPGSIMAELKSELRSGKRKFGKAKEDVWDRVMKSRSIKPGMMRALKTWYDNDATGAVSGSEEEEWEEEEEEKEVPSSKRARIEERRVVGDIDGVPSPRPSAWVETVVSSKAEEEEEDVPRVEEKEEKDAPRVEEEEDEDAAMFVPRMRAPRKF